MEIYGIPDGNVNIAESLLAEKAILGSIGQRHYANSMNTNDDIRYVWRHCDAVCFDVDSTVCQDEAIDELAEFCGVGKQVAEVTKVAMNGGLSFRDALTARLNLIQPSRQKLEAFLKQNPPRLTTGIQELVKTLHSRCVDVYLVSGGFSRIILPVARLLNVPEENVFANVLQFDENGKYRGFDLSQPTSDSGGKKQVCGLLKQRNGYQRLVMIGDGATDMEASPPADAFIGFGGNEVRESVLKGSRWFVRHFDELRNAMEEPEKQG
jgi:phosphoserine phosphatase